MGNASSLYPTETAASLLGCMIREPERSAVELERASIMLRPTDFESRHRTVHEAIVACWRDEEPVSIVTVGERLKGRLEGPLGFVSSLDDLACIPLMVPTYARSVLEASVRRQVMRICDEAKLLAADRHGHDPVAWLAAEIAALEIGRGAGAFRSIGSVTQTIVDQMTDAKREPGRISGLTTGLSDLDRQTDGLSPGELVIIGAATSTGKSALAFQIALHNAKNRVPVAIVSLEMSAEEIHFRLVASAARVNLAALKRGELSEEAFERARSVALEVGKLPLLIRDREKLTVSEIAPAVFVAVKLHGAKLVIVDYLQLVEAPGETQEAQVAAVSGSLKTTAARLGVPILVPAQLNREVDKRESGVPRLSDLRSSGRIAQDANKVLLLWRERSRKDVSDEIGPPAPSGPTSLLVAKSRNGPTGNVKLYWEAETTKFFSGERDRR